MNSCDITLWVEIYLQPLGFGIHIRRIPQAHVITITYITLCGWIKGQSRDTAEMYP